MIAIGLTGGIGTGKTTVAKILKSLGAMVIDADKLGHDVLQPFSPVWHELVAAFGSGILNTNSEIDRGRLGEIVFNDSEALKLIDKIMHPHLYNIIETEIENYRQHNEMVIVIEAAAFIEANWMPLADEVWVTIASESNVINRVARRSGLNEEQIQARIHSQMAPGERVKHAHAVIDTDCSLEEVQKQVETHWQRLLNSLKK
ncbi:MAG: dephospho-CoA kinase [Dehalococcoidia bacterium]|nr:dephospho-CoA kinase [Dehalococcoidia bacterium]